MAEKDEEKEEKEEKEEGGRPSWVNEILEALKPNQTTQEQTTEIPVPPAPATEEEEQEQEQENHQKPSLLKKAWNFLM